MVDAGSGHGLLLVFKLSNIHRLRCIDARSRRWKASGLRADRAGPAALAGAARLPTFGGPARACQRSRVSGVGEGRVHSHLDETLESL